ncbi:hypothetical protein K7Y65_000731 [Salmonella enterica]|nr:hypothetical protein [Salmonella enterica]EID6634981.1 hypothetical protein [Salmonella enterica]EJI4499334.1 hypothetical protein [Salmonella enterica]EJR3069619.1 hypothetical protein [Salmonella enterica]
MTSCKCAIVFSGGATGASCSGWQEDYKLTTMDLAVLPEDDGDGNTTIYDNFGGTVYGSDCSTIDNFGETTYVNDGNGNSTTYDKFGNTTYGSDGSTIDTYGNTTYINDGHGNTTTCDKYGNTTYCD